MLQNKKRYILIISGIFILILVGCFIFIPLWVGHRDTKMKEAYFSIVEFFPNALELYYNDQHRYPSTIEGLRLLEEQKDSKGKSYLNHLFVDPWDNPYHYQCPGINNKNSYDLWTYGADNAPGGKDENSDITNWPSKNP